MISKLYLCEASGARLLEFGNGLTQVGTDFQMALETWDEIPAGEVGDCSFRSIDVTVKHENGYNIGITPIVDTVELPEQQFSGSGTNIAQLQAFIAERGARISAKVRTITKTGDVQPQNIAWSGAIIRETP